MAQKRSYDEMEVSGMEESRAATVHGPVAPVSLPLFSVPVALDLSEA